MVAHWFDLPKFFTECKRVLRPRGCLSLVGYGTLTFEGNDAANKAFLHVRSRRSMCDG